MRARQKCGIRGLLERAVLLAPETRLPYLSPLAAIDLVTDPEEGPEAAGRGAPSVVGPTPTAVGLAFIALTGDDFVQAVDIESGDLLWLDHFSGRRGGVEWTIGHESLSVLKR